MRNQLSDKFDEVERDYLAYHQLYDSLLVTDSEIAPWNETYKLGVELP